MTEGKSCPECGEENPTGNRQCHACGASLANQLHTDRSGQAPARRLRGWMLSLLILGVLIAVGTVLIIRAAGARRHEASTYGISDPSSAALRIENRTSDFTITRVFIETAEGRVAVQDEYGEIDAGAATVLEIAPGSYVVNVFYVESSQVWAFRPKGSLSESVTLPSGRAAVVRLAGGRSSPEGLIFVPPELVLK